MNRTLTNAIRFVMDEMLPPIIRDSKWFMYPFFYIWFKGKNIKEIMEFKSNVYDMTPEQFSDFYKRRDSLAKDRPTDLSEVSIKYMLARLDTSAKTLMDVGCGNGYFLHKVALLQKFELIGCDIVNNVTYKEIRYVEGNIEALPFPDKSVDIVTAHHTLEHVINLEQSIRELKRVARKQIIVVVPCQKYYYYTLDEHIRFFPYPALLTSAMNLPKFTCEKIWGDLVYIADVSK
ncbi:MAG: class I SAM-dependent methyltransferase [Saprospiraceae bacterium]|nr:class I SAM-dependent methyltransferase [Saprospiraceae bacterium]MBP7699281.1 class I SAM-dependent methyltransferase [Saprospiraceae bacterium]